jgi:small subunit ribosomal protein S20
MANTKSAKKSILVNERNRQKNMHFKSKMKSAIKTAIAAIQEKSEKAIELTRTALKTIDKIASKGIIHKKAASRKKSSLMGRASKDSLDLKKVTVKKATPVKKETTAATPKVTKAAAPKATKAKPAAKKPAAKKKAPSTKTA